MKKYVFITTIVILLFGISYANAQNVGCKDVKYTYKIAEGKQTLHLYSDCSCVVKAQDSNGNLLQRSEGNYSMTGNYADGRIKIYWNDGSSNTGIITSWRLQVEDITYTIE